MQRIGKIEYDRGREVGSGQGMNSKVFLSTDSQFGAILAVKEIPKSNFVNAAGYWTEAGALFESRHDNVVEVQYTCETADCICLAMPYYRRGSLTDRIKAGPLPPLEVVRIGQGVLSGLNAIHVAGRVHYDVKPSNVLFSDHDQPLVADFGQARAIGPNGIVTPPPTMYNAGIPPELLTLGRGTVASDVYQAGLTLCRAVNGDPCFHDQLAAAAPRLRDAIVNGEFPDRDSFMPHVPRSMRMVLRKALHTDTAERYASAREFATALGRVNPNRNWSTVCQAADEIEWSCQQPCGSQLVVRLDADAPKWKVTIRNERPGVSRRTRKILWKEGLTRRQALVHLRQVFEALE